MFDMPWQDMIFTVGGIVFLVALFPSIFSEDKPALSTSFTTAFTLSVFALTYATLELFFSSISTGLLALGWWTLAFQKLPFRNKAHAPHPREDRLDG